MKNSRWNIMNCLETILQTSEISMFKLCTQPYSLDDLDDILTEAMKEGKQTNNQNITFWNIVFAFDIETTSFKDKPTNENTPAASGIQIIL